MSRLPRLLFPIRAGTTSHPARNEHDKFPEILRAKLDERVRSWAFQPGAIQSPWEQDRGTSLPTTAPGMPKPSGSVARLVTDVRGSAI